MILDLDAAQEQALERFLTDAPIYLQPWWLDAVAPGKWEYLLDWHGDDLVALMPVVRQRCRMGAHRFGMPPLTPFLGPWLRPPRGKYCKQLTEQKKLMTELIDLLPPHGYFFEDFTPRVTNWLPFYWRRFSETTRYTFVMPDMSDVDALWGRLSAGMRDFIHCAQDQYRVVDDLDLETFLATLGQTHSRNGRSPVSSDLILRIDEACRARQARDILFAIDSRQVRSVIYVVYDRQQAHFLLGCGRPGNVEISSATALLLWEAMKRSAESVGAFNFNGSMLRDEVAFFRQFGATQVRYSRITRPSSRLCKTCETVRRKVFPRLSYVSYSNVLKP